ncbi:Aerobic cobaltochelatase CobS subunit [Pseudonocardia sp. Ae168_Ps1]|uniref:AAA family ATPase n=1 Tax=unclassified Pseudonocardia TaxID=2619320 RepID=UPI00096034B8|nr:MULTISPECIES: AAA family ATPase [unclassified Pseudonocardia]OLL72213.1 Aerobic cobaltochelatase CobS subunit [Pseudonocardia sp. Ae150A_Ps1]OLL78182.1 Aerobic cobaltochelatase CobS subunit [Pseudonocardia sp. Ae168_Ps1]OLL87696.1 Aerobic cobaltochelatase CobS subunit [Pseudonocardia sp. Ae263_Ps1]OLL92277.1 Aerobic cobaltochelatase CobS subunit [Pseudonocardia sp. Ae356_Ps1]
MPDDAPEDTPGDAAEDVAGGPAVDVAVREMFGIDSDLVVPGFARPTAHVPERDESFRFQRDVTLAVLAGFAHNRRVLVQGGHGTGKSTHIEQIAARLNWGCIRVNLDGQLGRMELVGRDSVVVRDGAQVTEFQEGVLPWALRRPMALVLDEYDAGRPEVMFVIQRLLERDGTFTLLERNEVVRAHPAFRLFATANTVGLGHQGGPYHGVQRLNHAQIDRWNIVARLDHLPPAEEIAVVRSRVPDLRVDGGRDLVAAMVAMAGLTRTGYATGDLSTLMSPRTVITWAENVALFRDTALAFRLSFANRCEADEQEILTEYYQRCFDGEPAPAALAETA